MAKARRKTRRKPRANPHGIIEVMPDGFGFVKTAEGEFFIPAKRIGGAFDGDEVEIARIDSHADADGVQAGGSTARKPVARVVRVIVRAHATLVGRYEVADPFGVVVPQDPRIPYDIFTMRSDNPTIEDGSIVRVRMTQYPARNTAATGVIEEVLGMDGDAGMDVEAIISKHRLETVFSNACMQQANAAQVDEQDAFASGYRDLRDEFIFTVDPVDARDFDDAISIEPLDGDRWKLGVHIADVSHYVTWGSSVDLDARRRATSVYLVDRVVPMLPEALSSDVCSLLPQKPRRALSVEMVLDAQAHVQSVDCFPSIIESKARLSYDQAQCYINASMRTGDWRDGRDDMLREESPAHAVVLDDTQHQALFEALANLNAVARARMADRTKRGGIDFETVEAKVKLDESGAPLDIVLRKKTDATSCIEESMILANECVARKLRDRTTPAIFRVHEPPSFDALEDLVSVLQEFGYDRDIDMYSFVSGNPHALQAVVEAAKGRPEAQLVSYLVLRAMKRADYRPHCDGHFGLASEAYCHFTSPIRRYPDLVAHRMLKSILAGFEWDSTSMVESLTWLSEHSSKMERVAEAAARDSQELKINEYMQRFVGQAFPGIVVGIATYGLFVQLENTAEGLIPVRSLGNEYFSYDPHLRKLIGQDSGRSWRLGQAVRIRIASQSDATGKLEFRLDE